MKKIGILVPNLKNNGVSRVASLQSIMFEKQGFEVELILEENLIAFPFSGKLIVLKKINKSTVFKFLNIIFLFFQVKKIKKVSDYDYFISHIPHCDAINVLSKVDEVVITTVHNNIDRRYSYFTRQFLGFFLKKSDAVVTVSKAIADKLNEKYNKRNLSTIINIPNPIDLEYVLKSKSDNLPPHLVGKKYILNIGRLDEQKGQWHLIKAFSLLSNELDDLFLVIIGEGPELDSLKALCNGLNISHRVIFEGFQMNPFNYLANSAVFVLPSLYEGFPMVLIEAMMCSTPIIATDCFSGPRELLTNDCEKFGVLLPDEANYTGLNSLDISEFDYKIADSIRYVLSHPVIMDEMIIRAKIRAQKFSLENIYKEWERLFMGIAK